jgi:hypothetical protein
MNMQRTAKDYIKIKDLALKKKISAIGKWFDEKLKKHTSKSSENIEIVLLLTIG